MSNFVAIGLGVSFCRGSNYAISQWLLTWPVAVENQRYLIQICITCFWNQLHDSFCQPRQSCLDSPPHSLVSSSLSSSLLSSSITPGSKRTFSTNPSHLNTSSIMDCLHDQGTVPSRTYHASRFIFSSFFFNFSVCPDVWWSKLATRQLFSAR